MAKRKTTPTRDRLVGLPPIASVLGHRLDSHEIVAFLRKWKVKPHMEGLRDFPVGEISVREKGFDLILAFDEKFGKPIGTGKSDTWACLMRFLSPEYCQGKRIVRPWSDALLDGVHFPLDRTSVPEHFGKPNVRRRDARHIDECHRGDCRVKFCYRKDMEYVAFMELELRS
jgi:hypothetical protein